MASNSWQNAASAFAIGLGVGALCGILFAPKSGEETREQILDTFKDGVDEAFRQGKKIRRQARKTYENAVEHVQDVADAGKRAFHEAKSGVS